ncbi:unnamed protein product, partial [Amoebophrya sp. A120]
FSGEADGEIGAKKHNARGSNVRKPAPGGTSKHGAGAAAKNKANAKASTNKAKAGPKSAKNKTATKAKAKAKAGRVKASAAGGAAVTTTGTKHKGKEQGPGGSKAKQDLQLAPDDVDEASNQPAVSSKKRLPVPALTREETEHAVATAEAAANQSEIEASELHPDQGVEQSQRKERSSKERDAGTRGTRTSKNILKNEMDTPTFATTSTAIVSYGSTAEISVDNTRASRAADQWSDGPRESPRPVVQPLSAAALESLPTKSRLPPQPEEEDRSGWPDPATINDKNFKPEYVGHQHVVKHPETQESLLAQYRPYNRPADATPRGEIPQTYAWYWWRNETWELARKRDPVTGNFSRMAYNIVKPKRPPPTLFPHNKGKDPNFSEGKGAGAPAGEGENSFKGGQMHPPWEKGGKFGGSKGMQMMHGAGKDHAGYPMEQQHAYPGDKHGAKGGGSYHTSKGGHDYEEVWSHEMNSYVWRKLVPDDDGPGPSSELKPFAGLEDHHEDPSYYQSWSKGKKGQHGGKKWGPSNDPGSANFGKKGGEAASGKADIPLSLRDGRFDFDEQRRRDEYEALGKKGKGPERSFPSKFDFDASMRRADERQPERDHARGHDSRGRGNNYARDHGQRKFDAEVAQNQKTGPDGDRSRLHGNGQKQRSFVFPPPPPALEISPAEAAAAPAPSAGQARIDEKEKKLKELERSIKEAEAKLQDATTEQIERDIIQDILDDETKQFHKLQLEVKIEKRKLEAQKLQKEKGGEQSKQNLPGGGGGAGAAAGTGPAPLPIGAPVVIAASSPPTRGVGAAAGPAPLPVGPPAAIKSLPILPVPVGPPAGPGPVPVGSVIASSAPVQPPPPPPAVPVQLVATSSAGREVASS